MSSETFFVANHSVAASRIAALAGLSFVNKDYVISAAGALGTKSNSSKRVPDIPPIQ